MRYSLLIVGLLFITGCAALPLNPGSEKVRFLQSEPKGCSYLGEAVGSQGSWITGWLMSFADMETGARNELKNKAAAMGGNAIMLFVGQGSGSMQPLNVTMSGTVYNCPADALGR